MTNLQVVKGLELQIDASFKRSASSLVEQQLREDLRKTQALFRRAHNTKIACLKIRAACKELMRVLSPEDASNIAKMFKDYT